VQPLGRHKIIWRSHSQTPFQSFPSEAHWPFFLPSSTNPLEQSPALASPTLAFRLLTQHCRSHTTALSFQAQNLLLQQIISTWLTSIPNPP
jgi:hypothetical protein